MSDASANMYASGKTSDIFPTDLSPALAGFFLVGSSIASHFKDWQTPINAPGRLLRGTNGPRGTTMKTFMSLLRDDAGATAIEYGLIAALIAVAVIGAAGTVGTNLGATFNNIASSL